MSPRPRAALLTALLSLGCADPPPAAAPPSPEPAPSAMATAPITPEAPIPTLRCEDVIDSVEQPPPSYSPVLDVVALPAGKKLQTNARDRVLFAKSGLLVRARSSATLLVPKGSALRLGWGSVQEPVERIAIPSCEGPRAWVVYAGGFFTSEPACLELAVRDSHGREAKARVAVGADCE